MKRVFFLVFTLILIVSLSSCSIEKDIFYLTSLKGEKVTDEHIETKDNAKNTNSIETSAETRFDTEHPETSSLDEEDSHETQETEPHESDKPNNETVYWLEKGSVYHLYKDCSYLKDKKYLSGTLEECELTKLCSRCEKRNKNG